MKRLYLDNCCLNRPFDDLHCDYIITTDRKILNKEIRDILIVNPIDFLQWEIFYED